MLKLALAVTVGAIGGLWLLSIALWYVVPKGPAGNVRALEAEDHAISRANWQRAYNREVETLTLMVTRDVCVWCREVPQFQGSDQVIDHARSVHGETAGQRVQQAYREAWARRGRR